MGDFPKGGIIGKTVAAVRWIRERKLSLYAANACYFMVLAVFPGLLLLLGLLLLGSSVSLIVILLRTLILLRLVLSLRSFLDRLCLGRCLGSGCGKDNRQVADLVLLGHVVKDAVELNISQNLSIGLGLFGELSHDLSDLLGCDTEILCNILQTILH